MKKLFALFVCSLCAHSMISLYAVNAIVKGDLSQYKYVYVIPTSGVTSSSGIEGYVLGNQYSVIGSVKEGQMRTFNPGETIAGHLMRMGYTILPQTSPDFDANTMIVSYGYLEGRGRRDFSYASATIMIQFRDAKTQDLVASYETTGYGNTDAESVADALASALELFRYSIKPKIATEFVKVLKKKFVLSLTNKTPNVLNEVILRVTYYLNGEYVYEKNTVVMSRIDINETVQINVTRDKPVQSRDMQIKVDVISYK